MSSTIKIASDNEDPESFHQQLFTEAFAFVQKGCVVVLSMLIDWRPTNCYKTDQAHDFLFVRRGSKSIDRLNFSSFSAIKTAK